MVLLICPSVESNIRLVIMQLQLEVSDSTVVYGEGLRSTNGGIYQS